MRTSSFHTTVVLLAVANREPVRLSFDPFSSTAPEISLTLPLFAILFAAVMLGVVVSAMHTASVLVLGVVLFHLSRGTAVDRIYPVLKVVSGVLVAGLGLFFLPVEPCARGVLRLGQWIRNRLGRPRLGRIGPVRVVPSLVGTRVGT